MIFWVGALDIIDYLFYYMFMEFYLCILVVDIGNLMIWFGFFDGVVINVLVWFM